MCVCVCGVCVCVVCVCVCVWCLLCVWCVCVCGVFVCGVCVCVVFGECVCVWCVYVVFGECVLCVYVVCVCVVCKCVWCACVRSKICYQMKCSHGHILTCSKQCFCLYQINLSLCTSLPPCLQTPDSTPIRTQYVVVTCSDFFCFRSAVCIICVGIERHRTSTLSM